MPVAGTGPSGATRVVGVMGDPVSHSLSPLIHNTGFAELGLDWLCVAFPTAEGHATAAVRGIAALGIAGMSVTMPHKNAVIEALDDVDPDAWRLGAVNCIQVRGGRLVGMNTDGDGFVAGMVADFGRGPEGLDCTVLGAGGAARSVVLALGRHGARSVTVVNRTTSTAEVAAGLIDGGRVGTGSEITDSGLVVNATPLGMAGVTAASVDAGTPEAGTEMPCDPTLLGGGQLVVDLIYHPLRTPWLTAAAARGADVANGTSMLVHQAAIAFEAWTGAAAPTDAMADAVRRHMASARD